MGIFSTFNKKVVSGNNLLNNTSPTRHASTAISSGTELENRLRGALWGLLAGDALASPTHWFYGGKRQVISEYGHPITDYTKPNKHLAGSILNKSDLNGGGRSKSKGSSSANSKTIIGDVINHGKQSLWSPRESNHYHATLQKGENTLEVSLARVLMKSIVANHGKFDADHFRAAYIEFMTTPGSHNDTYASTCHRMFFANLIFQKLPPKDCPDNDKHNVDTIDGLVLPTIVALASSCKLQSSLDKDDMTATTQQSAADCVGVTRRSSVLEGVSSSWSTVVQAALRNTNEDDFRQALNDFSRETIGRLPNSQVHDDSTMSACYLSAAVPGLVDLIAKYAPGRAWQGLLANANVGGENVHRGSVLGAILGARAGLEQLPPQMVNGLYPLSELKAEIDDFVRAVLPPKASTSSSQE